MRYIIDRIEGRIAICEESKTNKMIKIDVSLLPDGIHDGAVLDYNDGKYTLNIEEEKSLREKISNRLNNLKDQ